MEFDFNAVMAGKTNTELVSMLENPDKYQPDAISAAKREVERRNLSESELAKSKSAVELEKSIEAAKSSESLQLKDYLILLLPVIGIFIVSGMYKSAGYDKKSRQATKIGLYYIAIVFGFVLLINVISLFL